jgi:hypothetical protein
MKQVIIFDNTKIESVVKKNAQLKKTPKAVVVISSDKKAVSEALEGENEVFNFDENLDKRHLKKDKVVAPKAKAKKEAKPKATKEKKAPAKKATEKKKK